MDIIFMGFHPTPLFAKSGQKFALAEREAFGGYRFKGR
jgi:hypothetical protein